MATVANELKKAALDGITAHLSGGHLRFDSAGDAELALLPMSWAAATTASPSTAAGTATTDSSVTAGAITKFLLRTSGSATRFNGTVGVGSGDVQLTDNVIPGDATSVSSPGGFTLSLQIT